MNHIPSTLAKCRKHEVIFFPISKLYPSICYSTKFFLPTSCTTATLTLIVTGIIIKTNFSRKYLALSLLSLFISKYEKQSVPKRILCFGLHFMNKISIRHSQYIPKGSCCKFFVSTCTRGENIPWQEKMVYKTQGINF